MEAQPYCLMHNNKAQLYLEKLKCVAYNCKNKPHLSLCLLYLMGSMYVHFKCNDEFLFMPIDFKCASKNILEFWFKNHKQCCYKYTLLKNYTIQIPIVNQSFVLCIISLLISGYHNSSLEDKAALRPAWMELMFN